MNILKEFISMQEQPNNNKRVSFRGDEIPVIRTDPPVDIVDAQLITSKLNSMDVDERNHLRVEAVRYDGEGVDLFKLNTGDVITVETAIALAEEDMLPGYTTGATVNRGRTLRSIPSNEHGGIHDLPLF